MFNPMENPYVVNGLWAFGGWIAGIASKAIGDKYTDKRRHKEAKRKMQKQFEECQKAMPKLILEMAQDLANGLRYEFFILDVRFVYNGPFRDAFIYHTNADAKEEGFDGKWKAWVHVNLSNKVKMLENHGFVHDITAKTAPHFRMTEEFIRLLKAFGAKNDIKSRP